MSRLVMRPRTVQLLLLWGTSASASPVVAYTNQDWRNIASTLNYSGNVADLFLKNVRLKGEIFWLETLKKRGEISTAQYQPTSAENA